MPELPEVETIARGLAVLIRGKRIRDVGVAWPRTVDARSLPMASLLGRRIEDVGRAGKYVAIVLDDGRTLTVHLRMTGSLLVEPASKSAAFHERLILKFDDGVSLRFVDPRKFGRVRLIEGDPAGVLAIGVDPFDRRLNKNMFAAMLAGRRTPIKSWLLDQRRVADLSAPKSPARAAASHYTSRFKSERLRRCGRKGRRLSEAVCRLWATRLAL